MAGRPRKPTALKSISGTDQSCRKIDEAEYDPLHDLPPAPNWLPNSHATREYERLGPMLMAHKLLTAEGINLFAQYCALHGKIVQLWTAGETPTAQMFSQLRGLGNDFGLTPVAQTRVRPPEKASNSNPFAKHAQRA